MRKSQQLSNATAMSSKVRTENCKLDGSALWGPWTAITVEGKGQNTGCKGLRSGWQINK